MSDGESYKTSHGPPLPSAGSPLNYPNSRSLTLCREGPPYSPTSAGSTSPNASRATTVSDREDRSRSGGQRPGSSTTGAHAKKGATSAAAHMYLFHSSAVPRDDKGAGVGPAPPPRPDSGAPGNAGAMAVPSRSPRAPPGSYPHHLQPTPYSLGRLTSPRAGCARAPAADTPASAAVGARVTQPRPGPVAKALPSPLAPRPPLKSSPTTTTTTTAAAAAGSVYDHVASASDLVTALQRRRSVGSPLASAPHTSSSPVYTGLQSRREVAAVATAGGPLAGLTSADDSRTPPPGTLCPESLACAAVPLSTARPIPYSPDSPSRSALPSGESSMVSCSEVLRPVAPDGGEEGVTAGARAAPLPDSDAQACEASPLPPDARDGAVRSTPAITSARSSPVNLSEGKERAEGAELYAEDAVGLHPYLASTMPKGRYMVVNLLATWGDENEVGLCGIELFDDRGARVVPPVVTVEVDNRAPTAPTDADASCRQTLTVDQGVTCLSVAALPSTGAGIHLLAQYTTTGEELLALRDADGLEAIRADRRRQLVNLVNDRVNTHDEGDMFVMPFTAGQHHLVCLMLPHPVTLSMIRVRNYCGQGRVHTSKGARVVEITMDDVCVFRGEVGQHSGELLTDPALDGLVDCENIVFTADREVLRRVMSHRPLHGVSEKAVVEGERRSPRGSAAAGSGSAGARGVTYVFRNSPEDPVHARAEATPAIARVLSTTGMAATTSVARSGAVTTAAADLLSPPRPASACSSRRGRGDGLAGADLTATTAAAAAAPGGWRKESPSPRGRAPSPQRHSSAPETSARAMLSSRGGRGAWTEESDDPTRVAPLTGGDVVAGPSCSPPPPVVVRRHRAALYPSHCPKSVTSACIMLLTTWGDVRHVGLSGLRLRDARGDPIAQPVARCCVQYPDGSHSALTEQAALVHQVRQLFRDQAETACTLPFLPAMQIVLEFADPVPSMGFLEVANYSVGDRTFCGAKEVRFFLSDGAPPSVSGSATPLPPPACAAVMRHLWTAGTSGTSRRALQRAQIFEVTPSAGVSLRKAPANLSHPRYQTYDLSLQAPGPLESAAAAAAAAVVTGAASLSDTRASGTAAVSTPVSALSPRYCIGAGPGTGASLSTVEDDPSSLGGGHGGGMQYFAGTASFASSLNASMNIRATMAMRRARMLLRDRPDWLLAYQPYLTPLLPVGYVVKVRLHICARSIVDAAGDERARDGSGGGGQLSLSSQTVLKAYLRDWLLEPLAACSFLNEDGRVLRPLRPGEEPPLPPSPLTPPPQPAGRGGLEDFPNSLGLDGICGAVEDEEDPPVYIPMVAESVLTTLSTPKAEQASARSANLQVVLELVYVADVPFCLSVLRLNRPLVLDGSAAWVRSLQVRVDDAMVYDSGDAVLEVAKKSKNTCQTSTAGSSKRVSIPVVHDGAAGVCESAALTAGLNLVPCVTSLRSNIVFTLDHGILSDIRADFAA